MSNWVKDLFGTGKAMIGLVHLKALPGDPHYDEKGGMNAVYEAARHDVLALQRGGIDGLLFSNEFSLPYPSKVDLETIAAMAYVMGKLSPDITVPFGNDVIGDNTASVSLAAATGACFTRGTFHGVWASSRGLRNSDGGAVARRKRYLGLDEFKQVYYLLPESTADLGCRDPIDIMRNTYFLDKPDALAVAGLVAGQPSDSQLLSRCRSTFPDAVIFAATGVKVETVDEIIPLIDGAFIGTHFKVDGAFENAIDEERVRRFMDKVKALRGELT